MKPLILHLLFLEKCLCSVLLSGGPNCDDGSNTVQHAVPGTTVSVSCSVDNPSPGLNVLAWTIPFCGVSVSNVGGVNGADIDQPDFVSTVTSFDYAEGATTATLSFPAMSALDGAVVNCADVTSATNSCTLFIMTPPSAPTNLTCTDVTTNSITIVWDVPVDNGGDPDGIYYEVTRTPGNITDLISTASIMETGLVFNTNYTFSIKANNSLGYSDSQSVVCRTNGEVFDELPADDLQVCLGSNGTIDYLLVNITSQDCPPVSPNPATTPDFDNFTITVSGFNSVSTLYCQYEQPISEEKDYDITVTINNIVIGSSEPTTTQFDASWIRDIVVDLENSRISYSLPSCTILNGDPLVVLNIINTNGDVVYNDEQPYDTESTSFNIPSNLTTTSTYNYNLLVTLSDRTVASYTGSLISTTMPTTDPTTPPTDPTDDTLNPNPNPNGSDATSSDTPSAESSSSVVPIVGGVVEAIVAVLVLIVLLVVVIFCYKKCKGARKPVLDNNNPIPMNILEIGQGLYQDPSTIEHHKAPTGDLYAIIMPEKSNKRRPPPQPEMATYQDPSTIQRQQAPTGDLLHYLRRNQCTHKLIKT